MANDNVNQELVQIFIEEAVDLGNVLSATLREWEKDLNNLGKIAELKRDLHTLKGSARMVGQTTIGSLAHELETLCGALEKGQLKIDRAVFDLICLCQDRMVLMVESLQKNQPLEDVADIIQKINQFLPQDAKEKPKATPSPSPQAPPAIPTSEETTAKPTEAQPKTPTAATSEIIRVSADVLEMLNSLSIENSTLRTNLEEQVLTYNAYLQEMKLNTQRLDTQLDFLNTELENIITEQQHFLPLEQIYIGIKETTTDLAEGLKSLGKIQSNTESLLINYTRISTALQYNLSSVRLVPFESVVPRLSRIARQISGELHKEVDFQVTQTEGDMDRKVLEHLVPSLEHILRNAVDHGIESIEERRKRGKPERGKIEVSFARKGSIVSIEVKDDGGGIDSNAIRKKAVKLGLLAPDAVISDEEATRFILEPGFSTREAVSEISGRGVGMDVVNMAVKEMGGTLNILSEVGNGTRMVVRFPFTISLNRILLFTLQGQTFGMLLSNIESVIHIPSQKLSDPFLEHMGKTYHLHYLEALIETEKEVIGVPNKKVFPVILLELSDYLVALVVDEVLYNRELLVQALVGQLKLTNLCSGATLLGDGTVVFVLDPFHLTLKAKSLAEQEKAPIKFAQYKAVKGIGKRTIMIVDDSISARAVTKNLLERYRYHVLTAKDGADALRVLETTIPDVILLDIDMPRMDGFEFYMDLQEDERYKDIPIIIVTARPKEHQKRAEELKLYNIVEKPYQETKLMSLIWGILGKKS